MYFYGLFKKDAVKGIKKIREITDSDFATKEIFIKKQNTYQVLQCQFTPIKLNCSTWFKFFRVVEINHCPVHDYYIVFGEELEWRGDQSFSERTVYFDYTITPPSTKDARFFWKYIQGYEDTNSGTICQVNSNSFTWESNETNLADAMTMTIEFNKFKK